MSPEARERAVEEGGVKMPELPEVETIRRGLVDRVRGAVVKDLTARECRIFKVPPDRLLSALAGQRIEDLTRRGKFLVLHLERHFVLIHLGMTGQLTLRQPSRADASGFLRHPVTGLQRARQHAPDQHTHLQIELEDGRSLLYRDTRKFGRIDLVARDPRLLGDYFRNLGLEPLSEEYTLARFLSAFRNRKITVKALLLDQGFVAGVGNIYADEALFDSGIHPQRRVHRLLKREKESLFQSVARVLAQGIEFGGSSLRDYVNSEGQTGSNQEELKVYGREGQPCTVCGQPIVKIVVAQRGTHFCPLCQPRNGRRPRI